MKKNNYNKPITAQTNAMYEKLKGIYSLSDWEYIAPIVQEINELKIKKNAIILAHNYMTPDIYHCVADIVGDSLALAIKAKQTHEQIIVMAGVHFMAESAKILSPEKKVLIPDLTAGCSLASSITAVEVIELRKKHPTLPVITYVNTTAEVKAETDICCTSSNVEKIVKSLGLDEVILIPDKYLAQNVEKATGVKCITWDKGVCEVHQLFSKSEMLALRKSHKGIKIIAHPECKNEVVQQADFCSSTSGIMDYVLREKPKKVALITECSMGHNIMNQLPNTQFLGSCNMCPHMKKINLENILNCLKTETYEIVLSEKIIKKSLGALEKMIERS